jgi:hypothetical protein
VKKETTSMRAALTIIVLFLVALPLPALAQTRPKTPAPVSSAPVQPSLDKGQTPEDQGNEYRRKTEERERAWDRKMRETTRGICIGC